MPTAFFKREVVQNLYDAAQDAAISFAAAIKALSQARYAEIQTGSIITQTAGNNHSVTFSVPGSAQGLTGAQLIELLGEIRMRYAEAVARLDDDPSDAEILAEMLDKLRPIKRVHADFTELRSGGGW